MKYENVNYEVNGKVQFIDVKKISTKALEKMSTVGQFLCPGKDCSAKLCLVHSSKNGGKTCFLKAVDDEMHVPHCEYKIQNVKERQNIRYTNGVFTERQVNDAVRRIFKDYTKNMKDETKRHNSRKSKYTSKASEKNIRRTKQYATGGKIIHGDINGDDVHGRMSRRYTVSNADIGVMVTVCGVAKDVIFNSHNEMIVTFKDTRLCNIEIVLGMIYKNNNPTEYQNRYLVKEYFDSYSTKHDIMIAAGGLINMYNGRLVLELQANGSFLIDNMTIMKMAYNKAKDNVLKGQ